MESICLAEAECGRSGEALLAPRRSGRSRRFPGVQFRESGIEIGLEGVVEEVGDEAEGGLGDDVDDLRVAEAGGADRGEIGVVDVAAGLRDLVGEL